MRSQGMPLPERINQALAPGKPLTAIINPSGEFSVRTGSTVELGVTVNNNGDRSALIDIYIDEVSEPVHDWCVSPHERLALGPGQSTEVVFQLHIPVETLPDTYDYTLVVDSPQHYPEDTPILHRGRITAIPYVQEAQTVSDPTFTLQPPTRATTPLSMQPGAMLEMVAFVHNRSDRVDRFRLIVTDLPHDWYRVIYPEGISDTGVIVAADSLELNPGAQAQIQLWFTPPADAQAAIYSPTVRLYSANDADLVLLDVVYFQVLPIYALTVEFLTVIGKVRNQAGVFELQLYNAGNTPRELAIAARSADEVEHCLYTIEPALLRLQPKQSAVVRLQVEINQRWRPFVERYFTFVVEVEDIQQLPLQNQQFYGTLRWEARPWWQFLLLVLALLGTVGALAFLIWWLLTRPPVSPKIVEFAPTSNTYEAATGDAVRLNWQIANPQKLQAVKIQGVSPEGVATSRPVTYDFSRGIPDNLRAFCTIRRLLICQNVPTDARAEGNYIFELSIIPKGSQVTSDTVKTNTLKITPIPQPEIAEFAPTQPIYQEVAAKPEPNQPQNVADKTRIRLNWQIKNANRIQTLQLIGRNPEGVVTSGQQQFKFDNSGIATELTDFCKLNEQVLTCQNVPTFADKPGTYIFELTVIPKQGEVEPPITQKSDPIKINPLLIPTQIVEFQVNGKNALPKYQIEIDPEKRTVLNLAWTVDGSKDINVELLPAPGKVARKGSIVYPVRQEPGTETLTLQATNATGETVTRSVVIETFIAPPPEATSTAPQSLPTLTPPPPPEGASSSAPGGASPSAPGDTSPSAPGGASSSIPGGVSPTAPGDTLPPPPGSAPPTTPGNAPPSIPGATTLEDKPLSPSELPPQLH